MRQVDSLGMLRIDSLGMRQVDSLSRYIERLEPAQRDSLRQALLQFLSSDNDAAPQGDRSLPKLQPKPPADTRFFKSPWDDPSTAVFRSLPDDWKDIDPFKHNSMVPVLPPASKLKPHNYARFYVGTTGYYGTLIQMGYAKEAWPDSLHHKAVDMDLSHLMPKPPSWMSSDFFKSLDTARMVLILLLMFL